VATDLGLFQQRGTTFQYVPIGKGPSPQFVHAIVEDQSGRVVVGGRSLAFVSFGVVSPVKSWGESGRPQIKSLFFTREGRLIIGTVDGAFELAGKHIQKLPFPHTDIESLCESGDGDIWAGTVSGGLWRLKGKVATKVAFGDRSAVRTVLAMTKDAQGRLWVGTQTGLSRIQQSSVRFIGSPAVVVDRETLAVSPDGSVYLVNGKVYRVDNAKLQVQSFPIPGDTKVLDALYSRDRSIWLGTAGYGVYRVDSKGRVTQYSTRSRHRLSTDYPRGIIEGTHGDIWVATEFGVDVISPSIDKIVNLASVLPSRAVRTLFMDHSGCIWIGTDQGPAVSCNGAMVSNPATTSLAGEQIWTIAEDLRGTMWFGTRQNGIYALTDSALRHLTITDGLPSDNICGLVVDRSGTLWASSLDTVFSIPAASIPSNRAEGDIVVPRSYVLPSDAAGLRFTRGRIQSVLLDSRGTIWFASDRGVAFTDTPPGPPDEHSDEPVPILRSVVIDNSILPLSKQIKTRPNPRQMVISFGADYLSAAQDVLLMYRLNGVDKNWTISTNPQRAEYSNLPAGEYSFELRACDRGQPDRWKTASYLIIIPVIWYRSPWFSISLVGLILASILLANFLHLRRMRYGFRLILEERGRVAREMHDTLIQGCNGVAMMLEAEAISRGGEGPSEILNVARTQIRKTVSEARDALWNLRHSETDSDYLSKTLSSIATHASITFGIPVDVHYPEKACRLPASSAHELMMIVREAVINAGTHGSPRTISINALTASERISITVADDGIGFDMNAVSSSANGHYGLRGMHERAAAIGARLQIENKPGGGTTIQVSLPLNLARH
jgi:signal transduction histidine kinase/ligand-binding sensor domain-containing protein